MEEKGKKKESVLAVRVDKCSMETLRAEYPGKSDDEIAQILVDEFIAKSAEVKDGD